MQMAKNTSSYGNESISSLKGADRVRKRPGVIFGSDGLEGCEHSIFEILSNSIDEAREGFGSRIKVTRYSDGSVEVQDFGRGMPLDFNQKEQRFNWELIFCELYAGGKYNTLEGESYEYSLGLNGLGACATQYSSEYMDVEVKARRLYVYTLHFEHGENVGGLKKKKYEGKDTGSRTRWKPDLQVFTDISVPPRVLHGRPQKAGRRQRRAHVRASRRDDGLLTNTNSATKTASPTMFRSLRATARLPRAVLAGGAPRARPRGQARIQSEIMSCAFCFHNRRTGSNITTTPLSSSTAARRKRPCAAHLSRSWTPT
jgi:hypothetical protein